MPDQSSVTDGLDLSNVHDPEMRRGLRAIHQHFSEMLAKQQMEIEALLELMLDKHIGSIGEFKRHLLKVQQNGVRHARIHDQIAAVTQPVASRSEAH